MNLIIGIIIGLVLGILLRKNTKIVKSIIKKKVIKENHNPPNYYGYNGGFTSVNKCGKCGLIGLYEDLHQANPCFKCGSKVYSHTPSKWCEIDEVYQWIPRKDK